MVRIVIALAAIALALLGGNVWQAERGARQRAECVAKLVVQTNAMLQAQADAEAAARKVEQARVTAVTDAANAYERGRRDAAMAAGDVERGLRAGSLRLRDEWRGCEAKLAGALSGAAAGAGRADAAEQRRAESAGRIIRAADECDAQVRGLQAVVTADRRR